MDKYLKSSKNKGSNCEELCGKVLKINSTHTFNESNLMTIPWISLKRKRVGSLERTWIRNGGKVGLTVVGSSTRGCPTIYELDVLMGLFKIHAENMKNMIIMDESKATNMGQRIYFTYRKLAQVMGLSKFGSSTKNRLEESVKCMTEATIYSNLSLRNQEQGEYVITIHEEQSCRILKNYRSYSTTMRKLQGETLLAAKDINEIQSVEIDDFFFNNLCSGYFKLFNYDKYKVLKSAVSKKILLILNQWSHGSEKVISKQILYDYIGFVAENKEEEYYYDSQIKKAADELVKNRLVKGFEWCGDSIKFKFNATVKVNKKLLKKYSNYEEVMKRLIELDVSIDLIEKYCRIDTMSYVSALLRYVDDKIIGRDDIKDTAKYVECGLPFGTYNVGEYEVEI